VPAHQRHDVEQVLVLVAVVAPDLLLEVTEEHGVVDGERARMEPDHAQQAPRPEHRQGLGADAGMAHEVDGHVEATAIGQLLHPPGGVGVGRIESHVGAHPQRAGAGRLERVEGDDRRGTDRVGDLHGVNAEAAHTPESDRTTLAHPAGSDEPGIGRGDGVGDDRRLLERQVVRDGDHGLVEGDGVLGPAPVEVHPPGQRPKAWSGVEPARPAHSATPPCREQNARTDFPVFRHAGAEAVDGTRHFVAEGHDRLVGAGRGDRVLAERAVDEVHVGEADAGGSHPYAGLTGPGLRNLDLGHREPQRLEVQSSCQHRHRVLLVVWWGVMPRRPPGRRAGGKGRSGRRRPG